MAISLNTKQDYLNYLTYKPEIAKKELQLLLDTRTVWQTTAILDDAAAGVEDDTHRVTGEAGEYRQQVLVEDPNAKIFRLGFTVKEVEEILKNA